MCANCGRRTTRTVHPQWLQTENSRWILHLTFTAPLNTTLVPEVLFFFFTSLLFRASTRSNLHAPKTNLVCSYFLSYCLMHLPHSTQQIRSPAVYFSYNMHNYKSSLLCITRFLFPIFSVLSRNLCSFQNLLRQTHSFSSFVRCTLAVTHNYCQQLFFYFSNCTCLFISYTVIYISPASLSNWFPTSLVLSFLSHLPYLLSVSPNPLILKQ